MKTINIDLLSGKVVKSVEIVKDSFGYEYLLIEFEDGSYLQAEATRDADVFASAYEE